MDNLLNENPESSAFQQTLFMVYRNFVQRQDILSYSLELDGKLSVNIIKK